MVEKIQNFGLSSEQIDSYQEHGYIILNQVFMYQDCQAFVQHMEDLKSGRKSIEGFTQQNKYGYRTFNQHFYDPEVLKFLISPLLRKPLSDCFGDDPEAIQTMHFYEGSEHERHQDQYYLPDCMSAWIAMTTVDQENGALRVQPGSHKGRLITKTDVPLEFSQAETYEDQQKNRYFPEVDKVLIENGNEEVSIFVNQGDVVLFHGRLIHSGSTVLKKGSPRHALACHYIPFQSENWDRDWPRISFDGKRRIKYRSND